MCFLWPHVSGITRTVQRCSSNSAPTSQLLSKKGLLITSNSTCPRLNFATSLPNQLISLLYFSVNTTTINPFSKQKTMMSSSNDVLNLSLSPVLLSSQGPLLSIPLDLSYRTMPYPLLPGLSVCPLPRISSHSYTFGLSHAS